MLSGRRHQASRRTVLGTAASLALVLLGGCSLRDVRIDTPPTVPELRPADRLRNAAAVVLARTYPTVDGPGGAPATTGRDGSVLDDPDAVLDTLRAAIGPVWEPPVDPRAEEPVVDAVPVEPFGLLDGLAELATVLLDAWDDTDAFLGPVLGDVLLASLLVLTRAEAAGTGELVARLSTVPAGTSGAPTTSDSPAPTAAEAPDPLTALSTHVEACFRASYAYEALAVRTEVDTPRGTRARERVSELSRAAEDAAALLTDLGGTVPADRPVWQVPEDAASAPAEAARRVEADLWASALPLLGGPVSAHALGFLWTSTLTHRVFGGDRLLRSEVHDTATTPTAGASPSSGAPTPSSGSSSTGPGGEG
ncbi:hypothetical protein [Brevibacterium litoralis]|uniref:hypothetical protein n=1 Tax=Brevibacterium litoralis TaxID=3138935 RepID=UPI0032ECEE89